MAIADHSIAARAISAPEEAAPAPVDLLGTCILADQAATRLDVADVAAAFCLVHDRLAATAAAGDAPAATCVLGDALTGSAISEIRPP